MGQDTRSEKRVLVVDDEQSILDFLERHLKTKGYQCDTESDGLRAIHRVKATRYDLLLLDVNMPLMKGTEMLGYIRRFDSEMPVIMISGMESIELVRKTLRDGAYDYLVKPLNLDELDLSISRALEAGLMRKQIKRYQRNLERQVSERTRELADALGRIEQTYNATILALGSALETRDIETQEHGLRVAYYSCQLAGALGITDQEQLTEIERGAYLHDIGKIGVPDAILRKPGPLTEEEWEIMRTHPDIGRNVIEGIDFLRGATPIVYCHHEAFDGSGYPQGLEGSSIPFAARIFAVADALDALASDRPYRKAVPLDRAREIIKAESGAQFDPSVVSALESIPDERLLSFDDASPDRYGLLEPTVAQGA